MRLLVAWLVLVSSAEVFGSFGADYYNDRYAADGISYVDDDASNGLWDDQYGYTHNHGYTTDVHSGCDEAVTSCAGTVLLVNMGISSITAGTFDEATTSITIYSCGSFESFEDRTFENLTQLETLVIQGTVLNHVPDLSNTAVKTVNLAGNSITIDTNNHRGWLFPDTIERLTLADNEIYWIPKQMISGSNLRIVSFSNNNLLQIQPSIFGDTSALVYLGMDDNEITRISKNSLAPLATTNFLHLNLSNNLMSFVQPNTFSSLPEIKIIEMHQNSMATITWNVFSNMPNLVHLDLHANDLATLTSKSFVNLQSLKELRLHSQKTPMTSIAYDAWTNINDNLIELFVSNNDLPSYPHQVLEESYYPNLIIMHADNNNIANITEYGEDAFPTSQKFLHAQRRLTFVPFSATPAIIRMYLHGNLITTINTTDLCELQALEELYLSSNQIRESSMDVDCFACLPELWYLNLESNLIQYVPDALKSSTVVPALTNLILSSNYITFLESDAFSNVTTLTTLYLSSNRILAIEDGAFPSQIVTIVITGNSFRFLHENPFQNLASLSNLQISSNEIQYIPDTAFANCISLSTLNMGSNNIAQLKKVHFQDCPLTGTVTFSSNDIGWIEDGTFAHITSMSSLRLENNKLTTIPLGGDFKDLSVTGTGGFSLASNRINILPSYAFDGLSVSYAFSITNNQITEVHSYAFNGVSARSLTFSGNPLRKLYPYSFNDVSISQSLTLSSMYYTNVPSRAFNDVSANYLLMNSGQIATIEESAFYDLAVTNLYLYSNYLNTLPNAIFGGLSSISNDFRLDSNNMSYISPNAFDNGTIQDLSLNDNLFVAVPQVVESQSFRQLDLQDNLIEEIPTGFLDAQTSLQFLYLYNNYLTTLEPGIFDNLTSVQTLFLSNNELTTLPAGLFDEMTSLRYLDMSNNEMTHIHDLGSLPLLETVYFTNNEIETIAAQAFSSLSSLTSLYLGNNPLECSCQLVMTLDAVASDIKSGSCDTIDFSDPLSTDYYLNANSTAFQCSGENVVASDITGTQFNITWEHPDFVYFQTNSSLASPPLSGPVTYKVICTSSSGTTFQQTETDSESANGTNSFTLTFTSVDDGVLPGTPYECSVKMEISSGQVSAKSEPAVFITPGDVDNSTAGPNDVELQVTYYDFSKTHIDFNNIRYITVSDVTYVDSPYGAWLAASTTPTQDTFSIWYRADTENKDVTGHIVLVDQGGNTKRFYSADWFPVDGQGYENENQVDCNGQYHNFGFTSAARVGLVYGGSEVITMGGGEAMWLYINKVKMFEFVYDGTTESCFVVDLSTATDPGGEVYIQTGTLSGSSCTGLVTSTSPISLSLELGVTYHFDWFHAETKRCTSELLFEVENVEFSQDKTADLPIDYTFTFDEDTQAGTVGTTVNLIDDFSSTGSFSISLYKGNEERRISIEEDTYTFTPAVVASPALTNVTDISGNTIQYVECDTASALVTMSNDSSAESFTVTTTSLKVTLADELDYEVTTEYYLLLSVTDAGLSLTGYIAVRVIIVDVNDNCPILSPTLVALTPQPVLQEDSLATFTSSDADSGENSNIRYVVSSAIEDPPVIWDDTYDLWGDVYLNYTTLYFDVIAMDNGTVPFGMKASANITVSNTCVLDVLFGKIEYIFAVNSTTGEMTLRIPKYWMYEFLCDQVVGLTTGTVLDNMMDASSTFHPTSTAAGRARVDHVENVYSELAGGWVAGTADTSQWVEVDMGMPYKYNAVQIQGRNDADEWVTTFKLLYYENGTWVTYQNNSGTETFTGNTDRTTVVKHLLDPAILSDKIRVNPQTWNGGNISMRLEFNGCSQAEQLYYDVSCMRCETTYYCEGEGVQKMCGRCENNTATCDRNPVEHSFGLALECTTCPPGWICEDGYATPCDQYYYVECTNTSCPVLCTHCEPGYVCHNGVRSICPAGSYSDGNMEYCEPCKAGLYQNSSGQSSCIACAAGYFSAQRKSQCDKCEPEEYSNGAGCEFCADSAQCPCLLGDKCYDISYCYNTGSGGFGCTECEAGLTGNGVTCTDVDECTDYSPCFMDRCINTEPGYQCLECPDGYVGTYEDAYAYNVHLRVFEYQNLERANFTYQTCEDVNECDTDNGGCDPLMTCVNTVGSYYCSFCASGYMGTNKSGCYLDNFCLSGVHDCIAEADCIYLGPAQYRCVCKPGYAGPGDVCGLDSDNDGFPDTAISCLDWGCTKDNCKDTPNSMQEDTDGDNSGDNCDNDDDNDGRYDWLDNCQFVSNFNQTFDMDGDGAGDSCDVCPSTSDPDQLDTDLDGQGDECDTDDDDDGIADGSDNCPLVANAGQDNSDGDTHGDACDNCPSVTNENQDDTNENGYGDACDVVGATNVDEDGDSILDSFDNCPNYMNGDQSDIDGDGTGDLCDDDLDGDGVTNDNDNCPYVVNSDQTDVDGNNVGDICESDSDGDGVDDKNDTCPFNPAIQTTSFKSYFTVNFDPGLTTTDPKWLVKNNGGEVMQTESTGMPTALLGTQTYGAVEYKGTWFTTDASADKYFGFIFGYSSNRKFYIVTWKGKHYNYKDGTDSTYQGGIQGAQLKVFDSDEGPGTNLAYALWHSYDTSGKSRLLWQDPSMQGWEPQTAYRWYLNHKPTTGYINLKIYSGPTLIVDSGDIYDATITGGRLGVFQFGEMPVIWSNLRADCLEHTNQGLYFDGTDDYVQLNDAVALGMEYSFTFEVWMSLDSGFTTGPYPILCSAENTVCLSIEGGNAVGHYGDCTVTSSATLNADQWYNIIFRHRIEDEQISIFIDGVQDGVTDCVSFNMTELSQTVDQTMYLGKDNSNFFRGTIDEVRIYSEGIQDDEISDHIALVSVERPVLKAYNTLHFRMEDSVDASTLTNSGSLSGHTANRNGGTFVTSYQQYQQFTIAYPNNR